MKGSVFKRCKCPVRYSARGERLACKKDHGSWTYVVDGPELANGKRKQVTKGGFRTKIDAEAALAKVNDEVNTGVYVADGKMTVGQWLTEWLARKQKTLSPNTWGGYRTHIEQELVPAIGRVKLRELRGHQVEKVLAAYADKPTRLGTPRSASDVQRLRATLRSALNDAWRPHGLVSHNAAEGLELATPRPKKARPWSGEELGAFLDHVHAIDERLAALFELIAAQGLRRGEGCGLSWPDIDFDGKRLRVWAELVALSLRDDPPAPCEVCDVVHTGRRFLRPKTDLSEATWLELDDVTVEVLKEHRERQDKEKADWGAAYVDHGLVFALENGDPLRPDAVTKHFGELTAQVRFHADEGQPDEQRRKLPHIRLHDLRHGAASLRIEAGVDMAIVSKVLRHSTLRITADLYTHLLPGVGRDAAKRANKLVPRRPKDVREQSVSTPPPDQPEGP